MPAKLYGHRGARGERPENTLAGFAYAKSLGADGIETDIAMTRDAVPVLHHDAALADGRLIKSVDCAELPPGIPTLAQALRAVPDIDWLLEIKTYPAAPEDTHPGPRMVEAVLACLDGIDWARLRILAFDWAVLREVARLAPGLRRVCLTAPATAARELWWGPGYAGLSTAQAVAASGAGGWAGFHAALTAADAAQARACGLELFAWTVNSPADFHRLSPLADGIITDIPSHFLSGRAV
jgi:glycerophosphoryl diester phosphodiesterase